MTYDAAGNQTYDCVGTHYYDAENRMTKAVQGSSNNYYFFDASGKRVRRILNGSQTWGGQETWFVYGFDGELVAEYAYNQVTAPLATAPQKEYGYRGGKLLIVWDGTQAGDDQLKWLVTDHLGSTRMEVNKSGSLTGIRRHDYLPFGEELVASTGAQRGGVGYEPPQSGVRQRFGAKERDTETGLDFFGARYFASVQGRFTSADPILISPRRMVNPQIWNLYNYVANNPLSFVDPTGEELVKLGQHTDQQIDEEIKRNNQQKKVIGNDKSLTKDERKAQQKALDARNNTLRLEKEGNRVVGALLNALDKIGQRNNLSLSDFTLTTDTKNDFKADATSDALKTLLNDQAFVIQNNAKYGGTIYIRTEPSEGFYQLSQRNSDFVFWGAGAVRHEQEHLLGRGEGPAYRVQDNVHHLFKNSYQNSDLYKGLDEVLHEAIKKHP